MAYIKRFAIEGLAGRRDVYARDLNADVNVFFGLNGSGKTSLLRILHSALANDPASLLGVPFARATVTVCSAPDSREFECTLDKDAFIAQANKQIGFPEGMPTSVRLRILRQHGLPFPMEWTVRPERKPAGRGGWPHRFLPTSRLYERVGERTRESEADEYLDEQFEESLTRQWLDFFGKVQANVRSAQQEGLVKILREVLYEEDRPRKGPEIDWQTAYEQMVAFVRRQEPREPPPSKEAFEQRFAGSPLLQRVLVHIDDVERAIADVMARTSTLERLVERLFSGPKRVRFGASSIEVKTADDVNIGVRSLSSGEKHALRIFVEAVRVGPAPLMVDEPEISLHLEWQRVLIAAMRELNGSAQLIFATHSPEIMADLEDAKIFKL